MAQVFVHQRCGLCDLLAGLRHFLVRSSGVPRPTGRLCAARLPDLRGNVASVPGALLHFPTQPMVAGLQNQKSPRARGRRRRRHDLAVHFCGGRLLPRRARSDGALRENERRELERSELARAQCRLNGSRRDVVRQQRQWRRRWR